MNSALGHNSAHLVGEEHGPAEVRREDPELVVFGDPGVELLAVGAFQTVARVRALVAAVHLPPFDAVQI